MPGLLCVSECVVTIFRPRMPPFALTSSSARITPSLQFVPDTAPAPESSTTSGMLTVCCASAGVAVKASATSAFLMIFSGLSCLFWRLRADIGLDQRTELRRHLGVAAEPLAEAEARLLQQHTQTVDGAVAAAASLREQAGLQGHVDHVVHHRARLERGEVDLERRLAGHAARGAVHQQVCGGQEAGKGAGVVRARLRAERA